MAKKLPHSYGTGRRKTSVARVHARRGTGRIEVNGLSYEEYFPNQMAQIQIRTPLEVVDMTNKFDIVATVMGGGKSGQAGALRLGIARALIQYDEEGEGGSGGKAGGNAGALGLRRLLRQAGLVTRDSRKVERKKVGLHGARKGTQYSKR